MKFITEHTYSMQIQAISGKNVCMCYESHAQSGSACAAGVLLQSSSYIYNSTFQVRYEQHT